MSFPKLRYPINTFGLKKEDALILLAYDMIYRSKEELYGYEQSGYHSIHPDLKADLDANLSNLGSHIETMICGGDMALRFEGYDLAPIGVDIFPSGSDGFMALGSEFKKEKTTKEMIKEFQEITEKEIKN